MQTLTTQKSNISMPRYIDRHHTIRKMLNTCNNTNQFLKQNNDKQIWKDRNLIMNQTFHQSLSKAKKKKISEIKQVNLKDCINAESGIYNDKK